MGVWRSLVLPSIAVAIAGCPDGGSSDGSGESGLPTGSGSATSPSGTTGDLPGTTGTTQVATTGTSAADSTGNHTIFDVGGLPDLGTIRPTCTVRERSGARAP